jgi:drug/metabolite transporter (DMT)-like permease
MPYLGEVMALGSALLWAVATILFKKSGETVHPVALNLFKGVFGALLIAPTIWLVGSFPESPVGRGDYLLLLVSGALGIGIADTLFFMSLNRLGAVPISIVDCLYSPFVIGAAMIWLGEELSLWQIVGVVLIISAVLTGATGKNSDKANTRGIWLGILWGTLAMALMAVGIVMVKPLLETLPLFWTMEVRLLGGIATLLVMLPFYRERRAMLKTLVPRQGWGYILGGSFVGGYLALFAWLAGMKYAPASQAAALNQTASIFIFVLAAIFLKEQVTLLRVLGIILGVCGVYLVTFG